MQLSGLQRRKQAPSLVNHMPESSEIKMLSPSQSGSDAIFGPTSMAIGAGPLYVNAIMGQALSTVKRDVAHKANSTIVREDSIHLKESENISRPDSWSTPFDCTSQAPYSTDIGEEMMTLTSLPRLPTDNPSHDLAFFLRTTGPAAPHRRPSKIEISKVATGPKNALRFLRIGQRRSSPRPTAATQGSSNRTLLDEGGLLSVPRGTEQKVSSTGQRYLALQVPILEEDETADLNDDAACSPSIFESRVSISFTEGINSPEVFKNWLCTSKKAPLPRRIPTPLTTMSDMPENIPVCDEAILRVINHSSSPVRPAASNPPSPEPVPAVSIAESYQSDFTEHTAKRSLDPSRAFSSHPVNSTSSSLPLPQIPLPYEAFPVRHPSHEKEVDIKHPSPRRFASHPVLLQRASSIASSFNPRSISDSPGPPPPRSPLRLRRDPRTIEDIISPHSDGKATPKIAPSIKVVNEYKTEIQRIKPTVITDCTGPIKRPKSRGKNPFAHPAYPISRKEREERIRGRKLRDRPLPTQTIDAVVNAAPLVTRQKLKKARPHIEVPDLLPAPLATRASSSASSISSWKKVTEYPRTPISAVPSEDTPTSSGEKTGYTPISPTNSNENYIAEARIALSPVMLVAEEIPLPKAKSSPKPTKVIMKEGKSYAPRPRSASIPRNAIKRRSYQGIQTPTTPANPDEGRKKDDAPPLLPPPPIRDLPPTPPGSGSEKPDNAKMSESTKKLPALPMYEIVPKGYEPSKRREQSVPHVATLAQRKTGSSRESIRASRVHARLEALEKQNAMLSAALMAVLRTNGAMNAPLSGYDDQESPKSPMAWESRIARRSAASHGASSSNGSALEMYMSTRHGSKHGR